MSDKNIDKRGAIKGRGALSNSGGRFESHRHEAFDDGWQGLVDESRPKTVVQAEASRSILTFNESPDLPFDRSVNPYRGCEHGCVYCFARPTHAYLGLSPGLDFETRLFSKPEAAALLKETLRKPGYQCQTLALGVNTDAYQPVERKLEITRSLLQVLQRFRHPVAIVTKSALIERDIDILREMAKDQLVSVYVSITTLEAELARKLEPRAAAPHRRLQIIRALTEAGIPASVLLAPVIPVLTDPEMDAILAAVKDAGAQSAAYILLRLPLEVSELFQQWLQEHYPLKAAHVMTRVRDTRGGKDYDSRFGVRLSGSGAFADIIAQRFALACRRLDLKPRDYSLDNSAFSVPALSGDQLGLF
ncbi:MAG: PA0069 family radical SAM protein [Gammaproteobacteria bacterium]|nr:PA0069 family radical SAM protein [Gammaproteobacteria bacterium]